MSDKQLVSAALLQAETDSKKELEHSPQAETGSCTVSTKGWSQCSSGVTESACNSQKADGFTVNWVKNGSC
jgi:hypothetical protein